MDTSSPPRRLPGLDGLRAVSVVLVLVFHAVRTDGFPALPLLDQVAASGVVGVQIFFVLSGFLITRLLLEEEARQGRIRLGGFYARRALRILPPAFAYLAAIVALTWVRDLPVTWPELRDAALFVRNLGPDYSHYTRHFWSLAVEEHFYLVWPVLLVALPRRARIPVVVALVVAEPVWRQLNVWLFTRAEVNWWRTDLRYSGLLLGALLSLLWQEPRWQGWLRALAQRGPMLCALALSALALTTTSEVRSLPLVRRDPELLQSIPIALLLLVLVQGRGGVFSRVLDWAPLRLLGRLSYSLYLWQQLFCHTSTGPWFERFPWNVGAALACAAASYWLVELPVLRWRARLGVEGARTAPVAATPG